MFVELNVVLAVFFFIIGACWGSFANVIILRLPANQSVVTPRSHCGKCGKMIQWYHNIPIVSWFLLRGKCAYCGQPISFRYVVVELVMASLFLMAFLATGWNWLLLEQLIFIFGLVVVSFIDLDHMILPDVFTLSGVLIGLLGALINPQRVFWDSLIGIVIGGGFLWLVAYFYWLLRKEEGMGGGDIKLLAWIGAVLGWKAIPFVIIFASVLGSIVGVTIAFSNKKGLKTAIPFGPYLAIAAIFFIMAGQWLGAMEYIRLLMPWVE